MIEVDVERLPESTGARGPGAEAEEATAKLRELTHTIGPVLAGLLIDVLDAATVTPVLGLFLGWPLGYYILRQVGCSPARAGQLGILVGLYCAVPGTLHLPLATLVGLAVKLRQVLAR